MEVLRSLLDGLKPGLPLVLALGGMAAALAIARAVFERRNAVRSGQHVQQQLAMLVLTFLGTILVVLVAPLNDAQKGQLLSLIGLLVSAAIALSSTTFVGNAMAGGMLRIVRSYRMGDFIQVGDYFGRVSERGLFHTEIQTEDRDLMTLPNLYLATNPVKVIRSSGTIISAKVSLGYDVHRKDIERTLLEAAGGAQLTDPFVHVLELGDFSVLYRVSGLLEDVKGVLSARSRLREAVLDALHGADIEIVSPNFMNSRAVPEGQTFIARAQGRNALPEPEEDVRVEEQVFDKAEEAESLEAMQIRHEELGREIQELEAQLKDAPTEEEKTRLGQLIEKARRDQERLAETLKQRNEA